MTNCGIPRLKALIVEAAQISLRHGDAPMHRWARRKIAQGKPYNKVIGGLARKMVVYAWHILMGHPSPNCEMKESFCRKLELLGTRIGKEELTSLGFSGKQAFAASISDIFYPRSPEPTVASGGGAATQANTGGQIESPAGRLGTPPRRKKS